MDIVAIADFFAQTMLLLPGGDDERHMDVRLLAFGIRHASQYGNGIRTGTKIDLEHFIVWRFRLSCGRSDLDSRRA